MESLGNLLEVKDDKVAERIFNFLYLLSEKLNIQETISNELNRYGFSDPKKSLDVYIDSLMYIAKIKNLNSYYEKLSELKTANIENNWNTAFDAALECLEEKLKA